MYEVFFSSIGILMGFLQTEFFHLSLYTKKDIKKSNSNYKIIFLAIFFIQQFLLFRFFVSLLYIYYYGSYVARIACKNTVPFIICIEKLEGFGNIIILCCIWALFTINLLLFIRQLRVLKDTKEKKGEKGEENKKRFRVICIVLLIVLIFTLIIVLYYFQENNSIIYREIPWEVISTPTCPPTPVP